MAFVEDDIGVDTGAPRGSSVRQRPLRLGDLGDMCGYRHLADRGGTKEDWRRCVLRRLSGESYRVM
jgi:hypothetical protein